LPVGGFATSLTTFCYTGRDIRKRKQGLGAGFKNTVDGTVKAGEVKIVWTTIDVEVIKNMIDADKLWLKEAKLVDNRADHVTGFLAALGDILPKIGGYSADCGFRIDGNIGGDTGSEAAKVEDFFNSKNENGEEK